MTTLNSNSSAAAATATAAAQSPTLTVPEPGGLYASLAALTAASLANPAISTKQLVANRANAQLSTGPKNTAISSQNRTTHGLARHNGSFRLLPSEDANGFEALKASLVSEHAPQTETESILVNSMAESHWLAQRSLKLQDSCTDPQTGEITNLQMSALYLRYHTTHTRAFHKALADLLKLRKEKRASENGFEAQKRKAEELRIKTECHEMKKQQHYWDVMYADEKACGQLITNMTLTMNARKENPGFDAEYEAELAKRGLKTHPGPWKAAVAA